MATTVFIDSESSRSLHAGREYLTLSGAGFTKVRRKVFAALSWRCSWRPTQLDLRPYEAASCAIGLLDHVIRGCAGPKKTGRSNRCGVGLDASHGLEQLGWLLHYDQRR